MELISIEMLLPQNHTYRKYKKLMNFKKLEKSLGYQKAETGAEGYGYEKLLKCLILQFSEDLSDREFERFINENIAAKWFCDFSLGDKTPDYTTICKFRNRLGTETIREVFEEQKRQLYRRNVMSETFTFVDSSALISKLAMWEERDKAIADGYEKFNNEVIKKYAKDPEVRMGCKGKNKFWIGYKKHVSVDMDYGFINQVSVTPANVTDSKGVMAILPRKGEVYGDKGYISAIDSIVSLGLTPKIILKNNMKAKDQERDNIISKKRMPFERVFSKQNKRVRYKGVEKNTFSEILYAFAFNMKRMTTVFCDIL